MKNGYEGAQRWVDEYERHEAECQAIMIEAAAKCAPIKALMKEVKSAAKDAGIGSKIFGAVLKERKHLRNAAKVRDQIDEDLHGDLDELRASLKPVADLPLFGSALEQAEKDAAGKTKRSERAANRAADVDALTDGAAHVEANVVALTDGIKPLH